MVAYMFQGGSTLIHQISVNSLTMGFTAVTSVQVCDSPLLHSVLDRLNSLISRKYN